MPHIFWGALSFHGKSTVRTQTTVLHSVFHDVIADLLCASALGSPTFPLLNRLFIRLSFRVGEVFGDYSSEKIEISSVYFIGIQCPAF